MKLQPCHWGNFYNASRVGEGMELSVLGNADSDIVFANIYLIGSDGRPYFYSAQGTVGGSYDGTRYELVAFTRNAVNTEPFSVGTLWLTVTTTGLEWEVLINGVAPGDFTRVGALTQATAPKGVCNIVAPPPPPWSGWTDSPGRLNPVLMDFQTVWGSPYLQVGPRVKINIQKSVTLQESVFDVACVRCVAPPENAPQKFGSFNHNLDNGSCFMWWSTRPADLLEFDGVPGWAAADQIGWQLNTIPGNDRFRMEPNTPYYLNIAFIQGWPNGDWKGAVQLLREGNPVFLRDSQIQPAQEYTGTNTYWGASQFA